MKKIEQSKIKGLIEKKVLQMMEGDSDDKQAVFTSTGTTTVHINKNDNLSLLLSLYLLNSVDNPSEDEQGTDLEDLSERIDVLQQKNKVFYDKILAYVSEKNELNK